MILERLISIAVPFVIHLLEVIGTIVIVVSAVKAFYKYVKGLFTSNNHLIRVEFAMSLALALEFKLASEILKTVIIRTLDEMYILAAIIILRAVLTFVIHWEIKVDPVQHDKKE